MKTTSRTEKKSYAFESARRCGARAKSNNGKPCRCPAIKGKARCRVHGGAKGTGAPLCNLNALKHGKNTAEAKAFRRTIRQAIQWSNQFLHDFD
ncbi:HGGxSTG domain-containing protein [Legionella feeleii]|uniref:Periplasmic glucans biosynthesis protein n=1 Tax=Legionella feeleii TaxID=453 RepID=A0A378IV79_9GAMM|nr:HGGxSTG domain-containing protein [Legionella feeleii]STX38812.1 Periplasmic glucans biosynthesis protein [Legionella feeleii]